MRVFSGVWSIQRRPPLRLVYKALTPAPRKPRSSWCPTSSVLIQLGAWRRSASCRQARLTRPFP